MQPHHSSQGDDNQSPSITSHALEWAYVSGETIVTFTIGDHQYELSFTGTVGLHLKQSVEKGYELSAGEP